MGRGRKLETLEDYQRALQGKYGLGEGVGYKPWLRVQDVKSHGGRSQIYGRKTARTHHFFSSIEREFFYIAEFSDSVVDIREQFPLLPLNVSQKIARTINVEHPVHPKTKEPIIITTDFLLTLKTDRGIKYLAVSVKPESEMSDKRTLEKIDIERVWWELLNVDFLLFTGNEFTRIQSRNISWASAPFRENARMFSELQVTQALSQLAVGKCFIDEICDDLSEKNIVQHIEALTLLRFLISNKFIDVDLSLDMEESGMLEITNVRLIQDMVANGYR